MCLLGVGCWDPEIDKCAFKIITGTERQSCTISNVLASKLEVIFHPQNRPLLLAKECWIATKICKEVFCFLLTHSWQVFLTIKVPPKHHINIHFSFILTKYAWLVIWCYLYIMVRNTISINVHYYYEIWRSNIWGRSQGHTTATSNKVVWRNAEKDLRKRGADQILSSLPAKPLHKNCDLAKWLMFGPASVASTSLTVLGRVSRARIMVEKTECREGVLWLITHNVPNCKTFISMFQSLLAWLFIHSAAVAPTILIQEF